MSVQGLILRQKSVHLICVYPIFLNVKWKKKSQLTIQTCCNFTVNILEKDNDEFPPDNFAKIKVP